MDTQFDQLRLFLYGFAVTVACLFVGVPAALAGDGQYAVVVNAKNSYQGDRSAAMDLGSVRKVQ